VVIADAVKLLKCAHILPSAHEREAELVLLRHGLTVACAEVSAARGEAERYKQGEQKERAHEVLTEAGSSRALGHRRLTCGTDMCVCSQRITPEDV
jgi:hypothetical protein